MAEGLVDLFHVRAAVAQIGRGEVAQIVQAHGRQTGGGVPSVWGRRPCVAVTHQKRHPSEK
jgi:hypothetical protein